jgi:hypothetical protein
VGSSYRRKRKERGVPLQGFARLGLGPVLGMGRLVPPACFLFLYFLSLLFYFMISDLIQTFANLSQINSNKFLNSSNVQQGILKP